MALCAAHLGRAAPLVESGTEGEGRGKPACVIVGADSARPAQKRVERSRVEAVLAKARSLSHGGCARGEKRGRRERQQALRARGGRKGESLAESAGRIGALGPCWTSRFVRRRSREDTKRREGWECNGRGRALANWRIDGGEGGGNRGRNCSTLHANTPFANMHEHSLLSPLSALCWRLAFEV